MFNYGMDTRQIGLRGKRLWKLGLLLLVPWICPGTPAVADEIRPLRVGKHLPHAQLIDITGNVHNLQWSSAQSRLTVFYFYDPHSPSCLLGMDYLNNLRHRTSGLDFQILAVESTGLSESELRLFQEKYRRVYPELTYPVIADPERRLLSLFGVDKAPAVLLVERHGVVMFQHSAFRENERVELTQKVETLLGLREAQPGSEPAGTGSALAEQVDFRQAVLLVGDSSPTFTASDLEGTTRHWGAAAAGRELGVLFFWGANCLPSMQEMIFLDQAYRAFRDQGLVVLAVETTGLEAERAARLLKRYEKYYPAPSFPIIADPQLRLSRLFGVAQGGQATYLIDERGVIFHRLLEFGEDQRQELSRRIELALRQSPGALAASRERGLKLPAPAAPEQQEAPSIVRSVQGQEFQAALRNADLCFKLQELDKALAFYLKALSIDGRHPDLHRQVAKIYGQRLDLDNALIHWQEILKISPGDKEALSHAKHIIRQQNMRCYQPVASN